jgi:hypothetical protein
LYRLFYFYLFRFVLFYLLFICRIGSHTQKKQTQDNKSHLLILEQLQTKLNEIDFSIPPPFTLRDIPMIRAGFAGDDVSAQNTHKNTKARKKMHSHTNAHKFFSLFLNYCFRLPVQFFLHLLEGHVTQELWLEWVKKIGMKENQRKKERKNILLY